MVYIDICQKRLYHILAWAYEHVNIGRREKVMSYLTEFFNLVSDETRLRIITLLAQKELAVCEICGVLKLTQPKVSKHLGKLRDMNFVTATRKEKFIFYSLNLQDDTVKELVSKIVDRLDFYPQLKEDSIGLKDKEAYLRDCKNFVDD